MEGLRDGGTVGEREGLSRMEAGMERWRDGKLEG